MLFVLALLVSVWDRDPSGRLHLVEQLLVLPYLRVDLHQFFGLNVVRMLVVLALLAELINALGDLLDLIQAELLELHTLCL